jgi:cell division protein ZapA (FtsZ GTPase activity inhibitor)
MQSELIHTLHQANHEIRSTVSKLSEPNVAAIYTALPPADLQSLNLKLARVAARLRQLAPGRPKEAALESALNEYLANLESLKTALGTVQDTLNKQRDHLRKEFAHMNSARAWVEAFRAVSSA